MIGWENCSLHKYCCNFQNNYLFWHTRIYLWTENISSPIYINLKIQFYVCKSFYCILKETHFEMKSAMITKLFWTTYFQTILVQTYPELLSSIVTVRTFKFLKKIIFIFSNKSMIMEITSLEFMKSNNGMLVTLSKWLQEYL